MSAGFIYKTSAQVVCSWVRTLEGTLFPISLLHFFLSWKCSNVEYLSFAVIVEIVIAILRNPHLSRLCNMNICCLLVTENWRRSRSFWKQARSSKGSSSYKYMYKTSSSCVKLALYYHKRHTKTKVPRKDHKNVKWESLDNILCTLNSTFQGFWIIC